MLYTTSISACCAVFHLVTILSERRHWSRTRENVTKLLAVIVAFASVQVAWSLLLASLHHY